MLHLSVFWDRIVGVACYSMCVNSDTDYASMIRLELADTLTRKPASDSLLRSYIRFTARRLSVSGAASVAVSPPPGMQQWFTAGVQQCWGVSPDRVTPAGEYVFVGHRCVQGFGLTDPRRQWFHGLCPSLVYGGADTAADVWRGALLAQHTLPITYQQFSLWCPTFPVAVALAGCARKLGVKARVKDSDDDTARVCVDVAAFATLLGAIGADNAAAGLHHTPQRPAHRLAAAGAKANAARTADAATRTIDHIRQALAVLGEDNIAEHLLSAARLRLAHPQMSLSQLAQHTTPPTTKHAFASRLRRLITIAGKHKTVQQQKTA